MTFADEVTVDTPFIWWDTRQAAGTTQPDSSGNSHTGTIHGSPTLDSDGLTFDNSATGDDQWIVSDGSFGPTDYGDFAFETVMRRSALGSIFGSIMVFDNNPTETEYSGFYLGDDGSQPNSDFETTGGGAVGLSGLTGTLAIGDLHHLVLEWDGADATLYLDGTAVSTFPWASGFGLDNPADFFIAGDYCACAEGFGGLVRHAIFYPHSLGPTRVAAHATAALTDDGGGSAPVIDTLTPNTGTKDGGTSVVIAGAQLTGATDVDFGATPAASFSVDSDAQITAVSPAHTPGTVQVVVTTPEGSSA